MKPKLLISDAAIPIKNGFFEAFPAAKKNVNCWAHVARNINDRFQHEPFYPNLKKDLDVVQSSCDKPTFKKSSKLLLEKWVDETDFCKYFEKTYVKNNNHFYSGYAPFAPDHNNGQEGFNWCIKRDYTLRERLPFNIFKVIFSNMIGDLSHKYSDDCGKKPKVIIDTPDVSTDSYRNAAEWLDDPKTKIVKIKTKQKVETFRTLSSKYKNKISLDSIPSEYDIQNFDSLDFDSFDKYVESGFRMIYEIIFYNDKNGWNLNSYCSCPSFSTNLICKHIVGIAVKTGVEQMPTEANLILLPKKKKKRGATSKAKKALQRQ